MAASQPVWKPGIGWYISFFMDHLVQFCCAIYYFVLVFFCRYLLLLLTLDMVWNYLRSKLVHLSGYINSISSELELCYGCLIRFD